MDDKVFTVVGAGYVGLSMTILLAKQYKVYLVDINEDKIEQIKSGKSPIKEPGMEEYLSKENMRIVPSSDVEGPVMESDYCIIATSTNYDERENYFDTSSVEAVIKTAIQYNPNVCIVIKSTVPVGFTRYVKDKYAVKNILFVPEFLREGKALRDVFNPSRIVIGCNADQRKQGEDFAQILLNNSEKKDAPVLVIGASEAEAGKLFANTYLAMRVSFFNELDTYAETRGLNSLDIITSMNLDPRIGNRYNNPSFGYGGYCLPKDTKQLLSDYSDIPNDVIKAIVNSNRTRKAFVTERILERIKALDTENPVVGIYRLTMKSDSDNYRESAVFDVINNLKHHGIDNLIVYEPTWGEREYNGMPVENDLERFFAEADLIIANRDDDVLDAVREKVYTRDLFKGN